VTAEEFELWKNVSESLDVDLKSKGLENEMLELLEKKSGQIEIKNIEDFIKFLLLDLSQEILEDYTIMLVKKNEEINSTQEDSKPEKMNPPQEDSKPEKMNPPQEDSKFELTDISWYQKKLNGISEKDN